MDFNWLTICAPDQAEGCVSQIQLVYLVALVVGVVLLAVMARRSRDLSTATLSLMPVAIAINIAVGAIVVFLRLPIYLDSIGTVLVGVLAGPWAGALTGILSNLLWSILPVPGGAGPFVAFFAPVAAVIGLMAGFWARQGVFRLRADDARIGNFLALAAGIAASGVVLLVVQATIGLPELFHDDESLALENQARFVVIALAIVAVGVVVGWLSRRTAFAFSGDDPRIARYLAVATGVAAAVLTVAILRLLFAPGGYFSTVDGLADDGAADDFLGGANLTGLAVPDPAGLVAALVADEQKELADAVSSGRLTQAQADEKLARAEERFTEMVNGTMPKRGPHGFGGPPHEEPSTAAFSGTPF
jgi:hypothetical protein